MAFTASVTVMKNCHLFTRLPSFMRVKIEPVVAVYK